MIEVKDVSKWFGQFRALDSVSFSLKNGDVVGYVGLNGAGKTTTIRICVGVLPPDSGDVIIDSYSIVRDKKTASRLVGWVPEVPIFELDERALDYFTYLAGYYGISSSEARSLGKRLLEEVGLGDSMNSKLKNFSLGMKKRFALAVSMINDPGNFLFDEVLSGIDPQGIAFFRELTKKFKRENKAVLFSSHILREVEGIADRVVFIHRGRIVKSMAMEEVRKYAEPVIVVRLPTVDEGVVEVTKSFSERVEVRNGTIRIYTPSADSSEILESLVKKGYRVEEVRKEEISLEEVFFKIIGVAI